MYTLTGELKTGQTITYNILDNPERICLFHAKLKTHKIPNRTKKVSLLKTDLIQIELQADYFVKNLKTSTLLFWPLTNADSKAFRLAVYKRLLSRSHTASLSGCNIKTRLYEYEKIAIETGFTIIEHNG